MRFEIDIVMKHRYHPKIRALSKLQESLIPVDGTLDGDLDFPGLTLVSLGIPVGSKAVNTAVTALPKTGGYSTER